MENIYCGIGPRKIYNFVMYGAFWNILERNFPFSDDEKSVTLTQYGQNNRRVQQKVNFHSGIFFIK